MFVYMLRLSGRKFGILRGTGKLKLILGTKQTALKGFNDYRSGPNCYIS